MCHRVLCHKVDTCIAAASADNDGKDIGVCGAGNHLNERIVTLHVRTFRLRLDTVLGRSEIEMYSLVRLVNEFSTYPHVSRFLPIVKSTPGVRESCMQVPLEFLENRMRCIESIVHNE